MTSEKQPELEHKVASDVNKENPVNDAEEKEPEDKVNVQVFVEFILSYFVAFGGFISRL